MKKIITGIVVVTLVMSLAAVTLAEDKQAEDVKPIAEQVEDSATIATDEAVKDDDAATVDKSQADEKPATDHAVVEVEKPAVK